MKNISVVFLFVMLALSPNAIAGGIVGSGAGIVEMNFQYVYSILPTWIRSCQKVPKIEDLTETMCETTGRSGEIFKRIIEVIEQNRDREDRIVFMSAALEPDFFNTGLHEPHRIAKTFLNADSSIYVNVDQLYNPEDGSPALDVSSIAAILVHEVGHQTGEPDHDLLNVLASQLRFYLGTTSLIYEFEVGAESDKVQMTFVNQSHPMVSTIIFNWYGRYSVNLTGRVSKLLRCPHPGQSLSGFALYNGQFLPSLSVDNSIDFNFWADIYCSDEKNSKQTKEKIILQATLTADKGIDLRVVP